MPSHFLPLPPLPLGLHSWPGPIIQAHSDVKRAYESAQRLLRQDGNDALRLQAHMATLSDSSLPLIETFHGTIPEVWIDTALGDISALIEDLRHGILSARGE